jgi:tetratricopeptide (TPR) repeat protein
LWQRLFLLSIFWLKRQSWSRACFFAFAYFLVALLPGLGLIDNTIFRISLAFDHLQYLASIGPLALAGAGLVLLSNSIVPKRPRLQSSLCAGLLLILGLASWQRALVYESNARLWTDTLTKNPDSWLGRNNLGDALLQKGQVDEALEQFKKALEIYPNYLEARYNLGNALLQKGQLGEAIAQYDKALEINPDSAETRHNLGNALLQEGRLDEAIAQYDKALEINPKYAEIRYNLGNALLQKGQLDEAIAQYNKAVEISPDSAGARNNLGNALLQKGRLDEAIAQYDKALEINPDSAETRNNLGNAVLQKGQLDEAVAQFQKAVEMRRSSLVATRSWQSRLRRGGNACVLPRQSLQLRTQLLCVPLSKVVIQRLFGRRELSTPGQQESIGERRVPEYPLGICIAHFLN